MGHYADLNGNIQVEETKAQIFLFASFQALVDILIKMVSSTVSSLRTVTCTE